MTPAPKRPLEIGDRVSAASVFVGDKNTRIWRGTVLQVSGDWIEIRRDGQGDNDHCSFHRRQVRRLVKRKRREWKVVAEYAASSPSGAVVFRVIGDTQGLLVGESGRVLESKPRKEGVK